MYKENTKTNNSQGFLEVNLDGENGLTRERLTEKL